MKKIMPSTNKTSKITIASVFFLLVSAAASAPYSQSALSGAYVFPGVDLSYNIRDGYRKFDGVDGYRHVVNANPFIIGLTAAKRISIDNPRLRFQAALEFGWGTVKDSVAETGITDGKSTWMELVSWNSIYWTGGLSANVHLLFPTEDARAFFISVGPGAHLTYFDTELKSVTAKQTITGGSGGFRGAFSPSINIGGGVEYKTGEKRAACIGYNMRFWRSASYKAVDNLFPMGVNYTEYFFTHTLQLQLLLTSD